MFGISIPEIILVMVVVLLVFGPERLPEIAQNLGKTFAFIRKQSNSFRRDFYNSVYKPVEDIERGIRDESRNLLCEDQPNEPQQKEDSLEKDSSE